jgi:isoquinoline 1-oxidoreductase beta subunit
MSTISDHAFEATQSRRAFLVSASAAAGGLVLGFGARVEAQTPAVAVTAGSSADYARFTTSQPEITSWIVIQPDDTVIIRVARSEMGQGALTALPMLVAEELECDWAKVRPEFAPPSENLKRKGEWRGMAAQGAYPGHELMHHWGSMSTGGSRGTRDSQLYLREAGAMARWMLIEAAAKEWNVPAAECNAANGVITHGPTGRKTTFGKVAGDAARIPPPMRVTLKDPKTWKLCGKPVRQINAPAKVSGALLYGIDVRVPEMLYATIAQCPVFGGKIRSVDESKAKGMPGVRQIVRLNGSTVCVIADSFWQAKKALDALVINWDEGSNAAVTSDSIAEFQRAGFGATNAGITNQTGDALAGIEGAAKKVEAEYNTPFLDHANMEPMNATARVAGGRVEVWVSSQNGDAALAAAAEAGGVRPENVFVHKMHLGGGLGRRGSYNDPIRYAVLAARRTEGRPVKLVYTREEDMSQGFYRPASRIVMRGGLDDKGNPVGLHVRIAGQSINAWHFPDRIKDNLDPAQANGFHKSDFGYTFPNLRVEVVMRNTHVPVGVWRSVNSSQNSFYKESFIDELAHAAGKDPFEFRRTLLANAPKHKRVLEAVAEKAGWGKPLPQGVFRGIAVENAYGSYQAVVAEASVSDRGQLKVHRIVNAIDCGHAVNPNIIDQQMQGSVVMAISAMLYGENRVERGRVIDKNFDTYQLLRIDEMPIVENHIVPSFDFWGGIGEAGVPPIAPAICNAIFAATGYRVRSLPLKHHKLRKA